jgi:hypothetical protein
VAPGVPISLFVVGAAAGTAAIEVTHRRRWRSAHAVAFGLEGSLLIAFGLAAQPWSLIALRTDSATLFYALVALPTFATGIPSASFRRVGSSRLRTTYLSGILTAPAEEAVFSVWREGRSHPQTAASDSARGRAPGPATQQIGCCSWPASGHLRLWSHRRCLPPGVVGDAVAGLPVGALILIATWHPAQPDTPVAARASSPPELVFLRALRGGVLIGGGSLRRSGLELKQANFAIPRRLQGPGHGQPLARLAGPFTQRSRRFRGSFVTLSQDGSMASANVDALTNIPSPL